MFCHQATYWQAFATSTQRLFQHSPALYASAWYLLRQSHRAILGLMHLPSRSAYLPCVLAAVFLWGLGANVLFAQERQDRALRLNADSSYVDLGNADGNAFNFMPDEGRTFAIWLRYDFVQYHAKIFNKKKLGRQQPGFASFVHQFSGTFGIFLEPGPREEGDTYSITGTAGLNSIGDGAWHHVALVQDDTLLMSYVDGQRDFTFDVSGMVETLQSERPLWLGWNGEDVIHFSGHMDEVSVWTRALSASEIRTLMYRSPSADDEGLAGYWSFDEADGAVVFDRSGLERHGRIYGIARTASTRPMAPPWHQQLWFRLLVIAGAMGFLFGLMQLYTLRIRAQNRRLEELVNQRTAEVKAQNAQIQEQAEQLKQLDATKSRFFANVSHEFRTPLTLSIGPLEDLQAGRHGTVPAAITSRLEGILYNNKRLLRLVNQLLDVARLEANALQLTVRPVDLHAYLDTLTKAFLPLAERNDTQFHRHIPDTPRPVYIAPDQLEKVFVNLLSNAFKFTGASGRVAVAVESDHQHVRVTVQDSGPGIAPEDIPHVFDRFYRGDDVHGQIGTGIGLALAQNLAIRHGGTITVASTVGIGSTFTVHLLLGKAHFAGHPDVVIEESPADALLASASGDGVAMETLLEIDVALPVANEADADQTTILLVDDHADIRAYIREHLAPTYRVIEAANGTDALQHARDLTPDLILSDVSMPGMDGFTLVKRLRTDTNLDFIPIILLTARAETEDKLAGLEFGADDYLTKPFNPTELKTRIHNLLHRQQRLRERFQQETPAAPPPAPIDVTSSDDLFLDQLRTTVEAHMADENFKVENLAEAIGLERSYLYRRMRALTNESPSAYLRKVRLERAAALIAGKAGTISEIAYGVGFKSVPHFSNCFRTQYGCSPSTYAQQAAAV